MTGYATLIKYALWALLIAACASFVWWLWSSIYDSGYDAGQKKERAAWQQEKIKLDQQMAEAIKKATDEIALERNKQSSAISEALQNEINAKQKLNDDLNNLRAANRGLWITAQNCRNDPSAMPTETQNTGGRAGETDRIRLPEPIEQDLWQLARDAQKTVIQLQTCQQMLRPLVDVIE